MYQTDFNSRVFLASKIWIVAEADDDVFLASAQCTTVPFKPTLTESIESVEIRGVAFLAEILMKVNEEPFTTTGIGGISLEVINVINSSSLPCSFITLVLILHSKKSMDAVQFI